MERLQLVQKELQGGVVDAVNWPLVWGSIPEDAQESPVATKIGLSLLENVTIGLASGNWSVLEGAMPAISYIGIDHLVFHEGLLAQIRKFYQQYDERFLHDMIPMLDENNQLRNGAPFDKIAHVTKLLLAKGVSPKKIDAKLIESLWQLRGALIKLHFMERKGLFSSIALDSLSDQDLVMLITRPAA